MSQNSERGKEPANRSIKVSTSIELESVGLPDDTLAGLAEKVLPELEKAGIIRREQAPAPPPPQEAHLSGGGVVLRVVALVGVFVLAYKGFDVLSFSPLLKAILGVSASAGVAHVMRRR